MQSSLIYTAIFFSLSAASALTFNEVEKGKSYHLHGSIPVHSFCQIDNPTYHGRPRVGELNIAPRSGTVTSGEFQTSSVEVLDKTIDESGNYELILDVPGLADKAIGETCKVVLKSADQNVKTAEDVTALIQ